MSNGTGEYGFPINPDLTLILIKIGNELDNEGEGLFEKSDSFFIKKASHWLRCHNEKLKELICNNESIKQYTKDKAHRAKLIAILLEYIGNKFYGVSGATIIQFVIEVGIKEFCFDQTPQE